METIVQKFGGTSVGSVERIQHVANLIIEEYERGHSIVSVVSAMGKAQMNLSHSLTLSQRIQVNVKWICFYLQENK